MNRVRIHQSFVLPWVLAITGCGSHLEAVQVTSAVGDRLSAHETALDSLPATCLEVATLSGASEDCTDLRARARSWGRVVALVEAYARGLRSSSPASGSEGSLAAALQMDAADVWPGLSPAQAQAAKTLSGAVRAMLLQAPSESELRSTIASTDAAVQEIARGIDEVVAHELDHLDLARTSIDVVRDRLQQLATMGRPASPGAPARAPSAPADAHPPDKTPAGAPARAPGAPADAHPPDKTCASVAAVREDVAALQDRLDQALDGRATDRAKERQVLVPGSLAELGLLQNDLESKRVGLERLRDAANAFARAHKALHDNLDRLGPDATLAEVVRAISQPPPSQPGPR
jgi:hypothetical protein